MIPTYEIYIAHTVVEEGVVCIEAENKHEAVQIAEEMDLGEVDNWEYRDNVSDPWVSCVFCDGQSLSPKGSDDVEEATECQEDEAA